MGGQLADFLLVCLAYIDFIPFRELIAHEHGATPVTAFGFCTAF